MFFFSIKQIPKELSIKWLIHMFIDFNEYYWRTCQSKALPIPSMVSNVCHNPYVEPFGRRGRVYTNSRTRTATTARGLTLRDSHTSLSFPSSPSCLSTNAMMCCTSSPIVSPMTAMYNCELQSLFSIPFNSFKSILNL